MPNEGKEGKESGSGEGKDDIEEEGNPVLRQLAAFATSEEFNEKVEEFFGSHCIDAADYVEGGTHKFSWSSLHESYKSMLEEELEGFCDQIDMSPEELFAELSSCAESDPSWPFVPEFMANCEYSTFIQNLHNRCVEAEAEAEATNGEAHKGCSVEMEALDRVKGIYMLDRSTFDVAQFRKFLSAQGVPRMFHKVFVFTAKNAKNIFGTTFLEDGREATTLAIKVPLDDETEVVAPVVGKLKARVRVEVDSNDLPKIHVRLWGAKAFKGGELEMLHQFEEISGNMRASTVQTYKRPGKEPVSVETEGSRSS